MSQPASLRPRILSALVFGVLLIGCLWIDTWSWRVLLCFFAVVLLYELSAFFWKGIADRTGQRIAIGVWSLVFMAWITDLIPFSVLSLTVVFWIIALTTLLRYRMEAWSPVLFHALMPLYIMVPLYLADGLRLEAGGAMGVFALFLLLWADDVGAYFIGSWWGKTPFAPQISPKKTWEGTLGGALLAAGIGALIGRYGLHLQPWQGGLTGLVVAFFGTLGDLFESMIKRHFGVKDSGTIMPGHGGLLDRLDSFLVAMVPYYVMMEFFSK